MGRRPAGSCLYLVGVGDVSCWQGCVQGRALDEILFPRLFVGGVGFLFLAGAEADDRDPVAAHDGHAVGGEGPLVGAGFASEQAAVSLFGGFRHHMVFGQDPRGEVAVGGVDEAGPRGDFVGVHGHSGRARCRKAGKR